MEETVTWLVDILGLIFTGGCYLIKLSAYEDLTVLFSFFSSLAVVLPFQLGVPSSVSKLVFQGRNTCAAFADVVVNSSLLFYFA